jgi:Flp pilus assembly protein TadG
MRLKHPSLKRRRGATTVEFAFVALLLFMMLFGIFEYGRFLFVFHTANNAARDAARFAVVRTGGGTVDYSGNAEPANITTADVIGVCTNGTFNGQTYGSGMCGVEVSITGYTVDVYAVTDANYYATTPNVAPASGVAWNSAGFNQKICVRISGTYQPIVPNLLGMNSNIPFVVTVFVCSEAN